LGFGRTGAILFVGLLLSGGGPLIQSVAGQVGGGSIAAAASPHVDPLASTSTTTTSVSTQTLPPNLAGVNGTTWEDDSGGTCADCTYSVYLTPGGVSTPNSYFLAIWYLTDPSCPPAVQTELVHLDIGGNGTMLNDNPGYTSIELCTRASNPIVEDCGQDQIWYVSNFTLTVTQTSISGEYQSQYWTWDTASDGAITNCSLEYYFTQSFTLTPVFSTTSLSSSVTTQQNTSTANTSPAQTSGSSTTSFSSIATSTTTSTHSGGSGHLVIEILAAAAVVVVLAAVSWVILRKKP
jgi:hypothetical protein